MVSDFIGFSTNQPARVMHSYVLHMRSQGISLSDLLGRGLSKIIHIMVWKHLSNLLKYFRLNLGYGIPAQQCKDKKYTNNSRQFVMENRSSAMNPPYGLLQ
jgi:hypothetical protein